MIWMSPRSAVGNVHSITNALGLFRAKNWPGALSKWHCPTIYRIASLKWLRFLIWGVGEHQADYALCKHADAQTQHSTAATKRNAYRRRGEPRQSRTKPNTVISKNTEHDNPKTSNTNNIKQHQTVEMQYAEMIGNDVVVCRCGRTGRSGTQHSCSLWCVGTLQGVRQLVRSLSF